MTNASGRYEGLLVQTIILLFFMIQFTSMQSDDPRHLGCYEFQTYPKFKEQWIPSTAGVSGQMTVDNCAAQCARGRFLLSGVTGGNQCFCGNMPIVKRTTCDGCCLLACQGKKTENCGGKTAMDIYEAVFDQRYVGCYKDDPKDRILPTMMQRDYQLTTDKCITECGKRGYTVAGTEFRSQCFCGNGDSYKKNGHCYNEALCTCNLVCSGDHAQKCGGGVGVSVYRAECKLRGRWGTDCSKICHCKSEARCSLSSGRCPIDECAAGWRGPTCNIKCPLGKFGFKCALQCRCQRGKDCNRVTGACPGNICAPGYTGSSRNPACQDDPRHLGCYEFQTYPKFKEQWIPSTAGVSGQMTVDNCAAQCARGRFLLSGVTGGNQCFCGNMPIVKRKTCDGCCLLACQGKKTENCGGKTAMDIYEAVFDQRYVGCYKDDPKDRILPTMMQRDYQLTTDKCITECGKRGYTVAGTEFRSQCFCGNGDSYKKNGHCYNEALCTCNLVCSGDHAQKCGGGVGVSVYRAECKLRGRWGTDCSKICHCKSEARCSLSSGRCPIDECAAGWRGPTCYIKCPLGKFGFKCALQCRCQRGKDCNRVTGACPGNICAPGYTGSSRNPACQDACNNATFGMYCKQTCHCLNSAPCDTISGTCPGGKCSPGFKTSDKTCQTPCSPGIFGLNCTKKCNCHDGAICKRETGVCPKGCQPGYNYKKDQSCYTECDDGTFGLNCLQHCHCVKRLPCNKQNGTCQNGLCAIGYKAKDKTCQTLCDAGTYGQNCTKSCNCHNGEDCNKETGACQNEVCKLGYNFKLDPSCQTECKDGFFGLNCAKECHCLDGAVCNKTTGICPKEACAPGRKISDRTCQTPCDHGTFGNNCSKACKCNNGEDCHNEFGTCPSEVCEPGYDFKKDPSCQKECSDGTFGLICASVCHCLGSSACNKTNGICSDGACMSGYKKSDKTCQTFCDFGTFGEDCSRNCHCYHGGDCNKDTGACPSGQCKPGYDFKKDPSCQTECIAGIFGPSCSQTCHCRGKAPCNKETGLCSDGLCAPGYNIADKTCQTECSSGSFGFECAQKCQCVGINDCDKLDGSCQKAAQSVTKLNDAISSPLFIPMAATVASILGLLLLSIFVTTCILTHRDKAERMKQHRKQDDFFYPETVRLRDNSRRQEDDSYRLRGQYQPVPGEPDPPQSRLDRNNEDW